MAARREVVTRKWGANRISPSLFRTPFLFSFDTRFPFCAETPIKYYFNPACTYELQTHSHHSHQTLHIFSWRICIRGRRRGFWVAVTVAGWVVFPIPLCVCIYVAMAGDIVQLRFPAISGLSSNDPVVSWFGPAPIPFAADANLRGSRDPRKSILGVAHLSPWVLVELAKAISRFAMESLRSVYS